MGNVIHESKPTLLANIGGSMQIPANEFWNLLQTGQQQGWWNAVLPFGVFEHDAPAAGDAQPQFNVS